MDLQQNGEHGELESRCSDGRTMFDGNTANEYNRRRDHAHTSRDSEESMQKKVMCCLV
jgi:hypothetical protein